MIGVYSEGGWAVTRWTRRSETDAVNTKNLICRACAPLMSTLAQPGAFHERERTPAGEPPVFPDLPAGSANGELVLS
jgi:hypothetical protein